MCDYSLAHFPNRLAVDREQLIVHRFGGGTLGLTPVQLGLKQLPFGGGRLAVCVPPGARLRLRDIPECLQHSLGVGEVEEVTFVEQASKHLLIVTECSLLTNGRSCCNVYSAASALRC